MRNRSRLVWAAITVVVVAAVYFGWTAFAPTEPAAPRLLVNEVLYLPDSDRPAFVEIVNAGRAHTNLDGVSLHNEKGAVFTLPAGIALDAGMFVVVRFDGLTGSEGGVVHAPIGAFLAGDRGAIWLAAAEGTVDGVVWGVNRPAAVELCRGGRCSDPAPGSVLARVPGETTALTTTAWAPLDPENATPGEPNPLPPVSAIAALPGTIFFGAPRFSWYSVRGATHYQVEVASDEAFTTPVYDADESATSNAVLEQLTVQGPGLPPGNYFWRVRAISAAGDSAALSNPMPFSIRSHSAVKQAMQTHPADAGMDSVVALLFGRNAYAAPAASVRTTDGQPVCPMLALPPDEGICKELPVPVIRHQKDTRMLTLEAPNETSPMGWDELDIAGYPYCARAGVAMVNAYHRAKLNVPGRLSQDRLGYEAFDTVREYGGPEYDLPVTGTTDIRVSKFMLKFALGHEGNYQLNPYISNALNPHTWDLAACMAYAMEVTLRHCAENGWEAESDECRRYQSSEAPEIECPLEIKYAWGYATIADVRGEIDDKRPIIATYTGHLFLVVGYAQDAEQFYIIYQDGNGREVVPVNAIGISSSWLSYWTGLEQVTLGSDEPSISADSDADGVVDFDEVERFETREHEPDSDADGVNDKEEIHYSVWDPDHGYRKTSYVDLSGDDGREVNDLMVKIAADKALRRMMELWKDSDDGGCTDGKEDKNANGVRDTGETSNFVKADDDCGPPPLGGHVHVDYTYSDGATCIAPVSIDTRFKLNPQIVPTAPGIITTFAADEMTYDIRTDGCADFPGDHLLYTFNEGFHLSGTMPLTTDNLGYAVFTPSWPHFGMQLPYVLIDPGTVNSLKGTYTGNGGGPWPAAEVHVAFSPLTIHSDPYYCTDPTEAMYAKPELLEFCTEPTPCGDPSNFPMDCLAEPQKYYVLPFHKSFRWSGELGKYLITDVSVTVDICDGCGND